MPSLNTLAILEDHPIHAMDRRRPRPPPTRPLVLIVDAHQDTRELYALALPPLGFEVLAVEDSAEAYSRAWETHPDIIVTEMALRYRDGWELLRDLKGDPRTRDIPVVVVTGNDQPSVRTRAEREGCAAFSESRACLRISPSNFGIC